MRFVIIAVIALLLAFAQGNPAAEAVDVVEGILVGAFGTIGHEIQECIQDGELIFEDVKHAIEHFENALKTKSKAELVAAFEYIGDALVRLPEEVKDCEALPEVVKDIEKIAAEFLNPEALIIDIGEKIIWHGIPIYKDVSAAVSDFRTAKYEPAGEKIGDIVRIIFLTMVNDHLIDAVTFTKAFYAKAFSIALALDTCEAEVAIAWEDVLIAVKKIEAWSVEEGVAALLKAAPELFTAFKTCEGDWPEIEAGLEKMHTFVSHPASIIVAVSEAVALDPISFPKDAYNVYNAFTSVPINYNLGGTSSGDIMSMVLKYMPKDGAQFDVEEVVKASF